MVSRFNTPIREGQPDLSNLRAQLLVSGLQQKDNPTYQVIDGLIAATTRIQEIVNEDIIALEEATHPLLDGLINNDTVAQSPTRGSLIYGNATPKWDELVLGASGKILRSDGTDILYSDFTIPASFAQGDIIYGSAINTLTALAKDINATRYLSNTGASNNPAWAQVNLANGVTGDLPYANLTPASDASRLLGRGSAAGAGDWQEITLGSNLTMTGTVLSSTGGGTPGGSDTQVQFNDGGSFGGDAGLTYDKTTDLLTIIGTLQVTDADGGPGIILQSTSANSSPRLKIQNDVTSYGLMIDASESDAFKLVDNSLASLISVSTTGDIGIGPGDILFDDRSSTPCIIGINTTNGDDDGQISFSGCSTRSVARGALFDLFGNQHPTGPGWFQLTTGQISGAKINFRAGLSATTIISIDGNTEQAIIGGAGGLAVGTKFILQGIISPSFTGTQNNYTPTGWSTANVVLLTGTSTPVITGFAAGSSGELKLVINVGATAIPIHYDSGSSTDVNRIYNFTKSTTTLTQYEAIWIIYVGSLSRWVAFAIT